MAQLARHLFETCVSSQLARAQAQILTMAIAAQGGRSHNTGGGSPPPPPAKLPRGPPPPRPHFGPPDLTRPFAAHVGDGRRLGQPPPVRNSEAPSRTRVRQP